MHRFVRTLASTLTLALSCVFVFPFVSANQALAQSPWDTNQPAPTADATQPRLIASGGFPSFEVNRAKSNVTENKSKSTTKMGTAPLVTVSSSLAVVLGLFAALVWVSRKYGSKQSGGALPSELVEVLGAQSLDARTRIQLIRVGTRIIVAAQSASGGLQSLSEISDADEVHRILSACTSNSRATFAATLQELEGEPTRGGFADSHPPARRKLFANA
jgi:flagellar protein FliO/FliZ